ncbi:hypothetical protein GCM10020000_59190 [Streptomyces olivoverticillatus]
MGGGEGGEELGVLLADRRLDGRLAVDAVPQQPPQLAGLLEAARGAQRDDTVGVLDAEELGEDAARVVGVVEEEHQVAQAHQGVGAVARPGQSFGVAVYVADHVDSHTDHPRASVLAFGRPPDLRLLPGHRTEGLGCGEQSRGM